tara:strand:- start:7635 stop:7919 length:285 start_codon:yes stop_codon:yes gene_type:complete
MIQIIEGWRNKLIPPKELKEAIAQAVEERMEVCNNCPHISTKHNSVRPDVHCMKCGCTLSAKTACLSCQCPIKSWMPIVTKAEEDLIKKENESV